MLEIGEDFLLKDLSQTPLCALCSGMAEYMIKTSSDIAQEILCEDSTKDEQKKLTTQIVEEKLSVLKKKTLTFDF